MDGLFACSIFRRLGSGGGAGRGTCSNNAGPNVGAEELGSRTPDASRATREISLPVCFRFGDGFLDVAEGKMAAVDDAGGRGVCTSASSFNAICELGCGVDTEAESFTADLITRGFGKVGALAES